MEAAELKGIVLIPVVQREILQLRRIGEFEVGKVPVNEISLRGGQIDIALGGGEKNETLRHHLTAYQQTRLKKETNKIERITLPFCVRVKSCSCIKRDKG